MLELFYLDVVYHQFDNEKPCRLNQVKHLESDLWIVEGGSQGLSVDGLHRDGTGQISRERRIKCFLTRLAMANRASKPHRYHSRISLTDLSLAIGRFMGS